jgi:hypothetical protein
MFKITTALLIFFLLFFFSCSNKELPPAKKIKKVDLTAENTKQGFDPLKHGFTCDSVNIQVIKNGNLIKSLVPSLGKKPIDTIKVSLLKLQPGVEKDVIITDFNFDGYCDFVLPDDLSASHGGMDYFYFLYNPLNQNYQPVNSLPKFNGGFKLDIKNQRVKIYCPYEDCFAYYKFQEDGTFKLVKGKFEVNP